MATSGVDLSVVPGSLLLSEPEPVADGTVWVNATIRNAGDTPANATALFYLGAGTGGAPFGVQAFSVGNESATQVSALLSTQDLLGYQQVTLQIAAILPAENATPDDNAATITFKVHMPGEVDLTGAWVVDQWVNTTGFVTLRGTATLTIRAGGTLWVGQERPGQFEILVRDDATLVIDGGTLASNLGIHVAVQDRATVAVTNGGTLQASVHSSSTGSVSAADSRVVGDRLEVSAGSLTLSRSQVTVAQARLSNASFTADQSTLMLGSGFEFAGPALVQANASSVTASVSFGSAQQAESSLPGITAMVSAGHGRVFPAIHLTGAAQAVITATVVESTVRVGSATVRSDIPIQAHLGARADVYRVAHVEASDPNGVPVANATVTVHQSSANGSQVAAVVAANGTARIPLLSDIVAYNTSQPVGSYKVAVQRGTVVSPTINLTFAQAPDFSAGSLESRISVSLDIYTPFDIYSSYQVFNSTLPLTTLEWKTSFVVVQPANFTDADVLLSQSRPFELFLAFDAGSSLVMTRSTIRSAYPFNLYLLGGASADLRNSSLINANILVSGQGSVSLTDSRLLGSVLGQAGAVTLTRSLVWSPRIDLEATSMSVTDSVIATETLMQVDAGALRLERAGLTGTWVPGDPAAMEIPSWVIFNELAGSPVAELGASPDISLRAGGAAATALTVWTDNSFELVTGAQASPVVAGRLLTGNATLGASPGVMTVEDTWVDPASSLALTGNGVLRVRGLSSADWSVGPLLTVHIFDPIEVHVADAVDLPVDGADVTAKGLLEGTANETARTDSSGTATLYLHRLSRTPSGPASGSTYLVSATHGNTTSATVTWDPTSDTDISLSLGGVLSRPTADGIYALIYNGAATQLLATSTSVAGARLLLSSCGVTAGTLGPAGIVYPGEMVTGCISVDLEYRQGGQSRRLAMAGGSWSVQWNGTVLAGGVLDEGGLSAVSFSLPDQQGTLALNFTANHPLLDSPYTMQASVEVSAPPKLVVSGSLLKIKLAQLETIRLNGWVTYEDGTPVPEAFVSFSTRSGTLPKNVTTDSGGKFFVLGKTGDTNGSFALTAVATAERASPSEPTLFNFTVGTVFAAPPPVDTGGGPDTLLLGLAAVGFAACLGVFYFAVVQRRIARGEFVECGNCGRPTYASEPKCRNCKVEFEPGLAKCSHCNSWISAGATECPQCGTSFTKAVGRSASVEAAQRAPGSVVGDADYMVPDMGVPASARRGAGRLEELEFKLPGTTETVDLGEAGAAPTFATAPPPPPTRGPASGAPGSSPAPNWAHPKPGGTSPVERVGLPRRADEDSSVREIDEDGQQTGSEPVSFGTSRPDLPSSVKPSAPAAPPPGASPSGEPGQVAPEMLREILRQAAPELSDELLPSDIRKELDEIARSEAPAAAETEQSGGKAANRKNAPRPEDRTMEAPEKSRKSAFDVFSRPAKNIPPGFERRGGAGKQDSKGGSKGAAAPVCPNCGGNWVVQRDGKNSCRVCGTRW